MPKLTNEELRNLKYVSMADYCKRVKTYENMDDKLRFTTKYLLLHGSEPNPDYTIQEATYIAQLAMGAASIIGKETSTGNKEFLKKNPQIINPHVKSAKEDLAHEMFMSDPCSFLRGYAKKNIKQIKNLDIEMPNDRKLKENCNDLLENKLDELNFTDDVHDFTLKKNNLGVKIRAELALGGKEQLDNLYKATKPGFFSRAFGTSSRAARNLDEVYKAFNNPNHALYGDKESMEKAANEYLQYKFPGWKPGDELPDIENSGLDETSKARALLSTTMLNAVDRQRYFEGPFQDLMKPQIEREDRIEFQDADRPPLNQNDFRDHIIHDLDESDDLIDQSMDDMVEDKKLDIKDFVNDIEADK